MYYLDYAKRVGDRYILNFFADSEEDLKDVPTSTPYITRNGTNYGVPLETSVVTIIEKGVKVNYVLQNGEYIAGGDVAPVVGKLEAVENKTYLAKDANLDGYSQVVVNVQPALQEKSVTPSKAQQVVAPGEGYYGLSQVTVAKIPDDYVIPTGTIDIITNGTHNVSGKASVVVAVPSSQPTLNAPTIAINDKTLTITNPASNGNFVTKFKVFSDGTALTEAVIKGSTTTVDLSTLLTTAGTYYITAKASAANFNDSAASSALSYTVAA